MELPNQDKIKTLAENETYKYLGIIKQVQMKDKWKTNTWHHQTSSNERQNFKRLSKEN